MRALKPRDKICQRLAAPRRRSMADDLVSIQGHPKLDGKLLPPAFDMSTAEHVERLKRIDSRPANHTSMNCVNGRKEFFICVSSSGR